MCRKLVIVVKTVFVQHKANDYCSLTIRLIVKCMVL